VIEGLARYPVYEDSGEPWLGEMPRGWELRRTKTLLRERSDKGHPNEPLLAATQSKGVVRKEDYENRTVVPLKDLQLLKLVHEDDFVISLRSFQGGIEYARHRGIISPAYTVLYSRDPNAHRYLAWLFKSRPYIENLSLHVTGIREGQNVDYERLSRSRLLMPPHEERDRIVRFLDHADRRIRRYISATKKLIAVLNEQKQVIVDSAVTRGVPRCERTQQLRSVPPVRVSAAWDTARLWAVARIRSEKNRPDLGLLSVFLGRGVILYGEGGGQVHKPSLELTEYQVVHPGDLVLNNQQAWRGSVGVSSHYGIISPAYVVLRLDGSLDPRYADYLFASRSMVAQFVTSSKGVGDIQRDVHIPWLKNIRIPIPPREEQAAIVEHLDRRLADLEHHALRSEREIDLVQEFRTRLIADVVTGKLDVRDAAVWLPDEVEEPEPLDDAEALVGGDESEEEIDLGGGAGEVDG
jgi:type I restriction enzyme, S subunit